MGTKHKHAEVIKAWADGEEVEYRTFQGDWTLLDIPSPTWSYREYRVKTKNIVVQRHLSYDVNFDLTSHYNKEQKRGNHNIEYTFTPEGKLISAKVL